MSKPILRALAGETVRPVPFWLMRQAGRYLPEYREIRRSAGDFMELCHTPDLAAEITLQPIRRFDMDAAILFSDILTIPHALGQKVAFREGVGPILEPFDPNRLATAGAAERLGPVYEVVRRVRRGLPDDVALIGFAGAPWTVATYMIGTVGSRDHMPARRLALGEPERFGDLIDLLVAVTADHLIRQVDAGADVLQLFDTWAGALPAAGIRRWCLEPARRIVGRVRSVHPEVPFILFPKGVGPLSAEFAGIAEGVGLDAAAEPGWAAGLQGRCTVQGNLDPVLLSVGGTAMLEAASDILSGLASGPHIFNLGHGVLPDTPLEHVGELRNLVLETP